MKCAGGVEIVQHKPCPKCGAKSDGPCPVGLANEREAFRDMLAALKDVVADIQEYEKINNLAPNPGRQDCWDSVTRAKAIIAKAQL